MPTFLLDGKEIEFKQGQTIMEAALAAGVEIPHFCWHPALSIAGNCRICLVEVEKAPKGQIACATHAMEGMVVYANSPKAVKMRNAVMEFLLINHPLDCPICDEAGECKLQDYAYKYSIGKSRFEEAKVHKDKRIELGPNVMFDQERCISCSRCIRFCEEIVGDPQLTFVHRGEHVTIETFPGKKLDNPYSMNVIELCPVGALTSRDFRFKARVWDMSSTPGICTGCSRGCNINIWVRDNQILRLTPRENQEVNKYWMCDHGRLDTFKYVNDEKTRINAPMIKSDGITSEKESLENCDWDAAIARAVSELKNYNTDEIAFIASAFSVLEDNYVLKKFANDVIGTDKIAYIPKNEGEDDNLLIRADKTPNSKGLELLGIKPLGSEFLDNINNNKIKLLYIINDSISRIPLAGEKLPDSIILHAWSRDVSTYRATVVFPSATYAESNGTFVNFEGRVQRTRPAVATLEQERLPGEFEVSRLDKFGAHNDRWTKGIRFNARPVWKVISNIANTLGIKFFYENTEDVFDDLCSNVDIFNGLSYGVIGEHGATVCMEEKVG